MERKLNKTWISSREKGSPTVQYMEWLQALSSGYTYQRRSKSTTIQSTREKKTELKQKTYLVEADRIEP